MAEAGVWSTYFYPLFLTVGYILAIIVPLMLVLAFITYFERKVWAAIQLRKGPNVVGPFGLLQPVADGIKCLFKETIVPAGANRMLFVLAPMVTFSLGLIGWAVIPFDQHLVLADLNVGLLYLFAVSSLGVYGIIIAGWASNSKYAFLGALRSAAQMVSYEVSIGFVLVTVLLCVGSLNLNAIVEAQRGLWFFIPLFPMFVIYFVSALAETNRTPFDLPEAEGELVAGYQVEYSSMTWLLFMMGEYANIVLLERSQRHPVPGRLAAALPRRAADRGPRRGLVPAEDRGRRLLLHVDARDASALPLRSAHAARLEGVPAGLARHGRDRRGRAARVRLPR